MKYLLTTTALVAGVCCFAATGSAAPLSLTADGITYTLTETSITNGGLTGNFTFTISGENTASDTEGGRSGINAIAFNQPAPGTVTSGTMSSPPNFTFQLGGLNSSGCNLTGNFFCFDNTTIPPTPGGTLSGLLTFNFSVTANTAGVWNGYTTDLKIDWVGTQNNYDLVSLPIPVNTGTTPPPPPPIPEPASIALLGLGLLGLGLVRQRPRT